MNEIEFLRLTVLLLGAIAMANIILLALVLQRVLPDTNSVWERNQ